MILLLISCLSTSLDIEPTESKPDLVGTTTETITTSSTTPVEPPRKVIGCGEPEMVLQTGGYPGDDFIYGLKTHRDGGIVMAFISEGQTGFDEPFNAGGRYTGIVLADEDGNIQWQQALSGYRISYRDMDTAHDGSIAISGTYRSDITIGEDILDVDYRGVDPPFLVVLNPDGSYRGGFSASFDGGSEMVDVSASKTGYTWIFRGANFNDIPEREPYYFWDGTTKYHFGGQNAGALSFVVQTDLDGKILWYKVFEESLIIAASGNGEVLAVSIELREETEVNDGVILPADTYSSTTLLLLDQKTGEITGHHQEFVKPNANATSAGIWFNDLKVFPDHIEMLVNQADAKRVFGKVPETHAFWATLDLEGNFLSSNPSGSITEFDLPAAQVYSRGENYNSHSGVLYKDQHWETPSGAVSYTSGYFPGVGPEWEELNPIHITLEDRDANTLCVVLPYNIAPFRNTVTENYLWFGGIFEEVDVYVNGQWYAGSGSRYNVEARVFRVPLIFETLEPTESK